ncbi:Uncharacterised protein [Serratia ficaria]|uniref:hypothetical protein n=1 Tax=Serratia ficaria TaxID=61651 RepID=UPI0021C4E87F|nr:hypothetical protein [Serratia ficaria]CAI2794137.1 Uncharacterised protein [Serratia ficaria]
MPKARAFTQIKQIVTVTINKEAGIVDFTKEQLIEQATANVKDCRSLTRVSPNVVHKLNLRLAEITLEALTEKQEGIERAIDLACRFGGSDEIHHLQWVIDQMVRELAGDHYTQVVADAIAGEDGPNTYTWNVGIAP